MTTVTSASTPRWRTYAVYFVLAVLSVVFLLNGIAKLANVEMQVTSFAHWGYPLWFMYVTGIIEIVCAVLLWPHRTRLFAAVGLICVMLGAVATHLLNAEWYMLPGVGVLLLLSGLVAWVNRSTR